MADTKVSALPAVAAALGADEIPVNEAGTSKKLTVTQIAAYLADLAQTLTNKTIDASQLAGIIADARMPNLTGEVTTTEGAVAATVAATHSGSSHANLPAGAQVNGSNILVSGGALGTPSSGVMTNVTGLTTAGLVDDAVTYAKIQNVSATDRVLGRTTAGAGDIEEIATTGSGSVVRATSPTLVTPALGTPASGTMTNVTGLTEAGQTLADNTTNDVSTTKHGYAPKAPNDATKFLDGTGAYTVPSGGSSNVEFRASTSFETAARFTATATNAGSISYNTSGVEILTSATGTSGEKLTWTMGAGNGGASMMLLSPVFSAHIYGVALGTDFDYGIGIANWTATGDAVAFTVRHVGFKITRRSSGTVSLFATQADATTENASSALFTFAATDDVSLKLKVNSTTSVDYYTSQNSGAWSAATNLTSNMPTSLVQGHMCGMIISNVAVASNSRIGHSAASYAR